MHSLHQIKSHIRPALTGPEELDDPESGIVFKANITAVFSCTSEEHPTDSVREVPCI